MVSAATDRGDCALGVRRPRGAQPSAAAPASKVGALQTDRRFRLGMAEEDRSRTCRARFETKFYRGATQPDSDGGERIGEDLHHQEYCLSGGDGGQERDLPDRVGTDLGAQWREPPSAKAKVQSLWASRLPVY